MTDSQAVNLSCFFTKAIRDQLSRKGLAVRRTGYDKRTSPTVQAVTHEDGVVEVSHLRSWDIGRWEILGDYEAIPQSYFDKHRPESEGDGVDEPVVYYFPADRSRTYSSVAGDLLLAVR